MVAETKKNQSKQNVFKITTNKVFAIAIVALLLISIIQTCFICILWQLRDMDNAAQFNELLIDANKGLYETGKEHVILSSEGALIPEANIKLPKSPQMYGISGTYYDYDDGSSSELILMNRSSLAVANFSIYETNIYKTETQELNGSIPKAQACTRQVVVQFDNSEISEGYEQAFTKTLKDGRTAMGYKSTICTEGANEFANYVANLESI